MKRFLIALCVLFVFAATANAIGRRGGCPGGNCGTQQQAVTVSEGSAGGGSAGYSGGSAGGNGGQRQGLFSRLRSRRSSGGGSSGGEGSAGGYGSQGGQGSAGGTYNSANNATSNEAGAYPYVPIGPPLPPSAYVRCPRCGNTIVVMRGNGNKQAGCGCCGGNCDKCTGKPGCDCGCADCTCNDKQQRKDTTARPQTKVVPPPERTKAPAEK